MGQFHLTSLVVMDAFSSAIVVGWFVHEEKTAEALTCGFAAWRSAIVGVMQYFKPANFFLTTIQPSTKRSGLGVVYRFPNIALVPGRVV